MTYTVIVSRLGQDGQFRFDDEQHAMSVAEMYADLGFKTSVMPTEFVPRSMPKRVS